jgi:hypothetical protein
MSKRIENPSQAPNVTRTTVQNFQTSIQFNYPENYTISHEWKFFLLDDTSFTVLNQVNVPIIESINPLSIVIEKNKMFYGLYKIMLLFDIDMSNKMQIFQEEVLTYVKIVPTGLNIYALEHGIPFYTIGRLQTIQLIPARFSWDPDEITDCGALSYSFYCKLVDKTLGHYNFVLNDQSRDDLNSSKLTNLFSSDSCFTSASNDLKVCFLYRPKDHFD